MVGRERFPSRCDLFSQPLWVQNELLLFTPRGDAEVDEFEAAFVLRARVVKKRKDGIGRVGTEDSKQETATIAVFRFKGIVLCHGRHANSCSLADAFRLADAPRYAEFCRGEYSQGEARSTRIAAFPWPCSIWYSWAQSRHRSDRSILWASLDRVDEDGPIRTFKVERRAHRDLRKADLGRHVLERSNSDQALSNAAKSKPSARAGSRIRLSLARSVLIAPVRSTTTSAGITSAP